MFIYYIENMKISKSNITNITIEECHQLMLRLPPKTKSEVGLFIQ
jgi:predicted transcriptional regulator